jgi:hypothetical protein
MTATDELTAARLRLTMAVLTTAGESHEGLRNDAAWLKLLANTTIALNRVEKKDPTAAIELVRQLEKAANF